MVTVWCFPEEHPPWFENPRNLVEYHLRCLQVLEHIVGKHQVKTLVWIRDRFPNALLALVKIRVLGYPGIRIQPAHFPCQSPKVHLGDNPRTRPHIQHLHVGLQMIKDGSSEQGVIPIVLKLLVIALVNPLDNIHYAFSQLGDAPSRSTSARLEKKLIHALGVRGN